MKLLVKILLFVFLVLAVNVNVTGAIITYSNIHQEKITPLSFDKEKTKSVFKDIEIDLSNCCKKGNDLVDYRNRGTGIEAVAAKGGTKLLNQFNSAESLIQGAGNLTKVKAGMQGFVKGDGPSIFNAITQGGKLQSNGQYLMQNGMQIGNHLSKTTGAYTIHITPATGKMIKIRVTP